MHSLVFGMPDSFVFILKKTCPENLRHSNSLPNTFNISNSLMCEKGNEQFHIKGELELTDPFNLLINVKLRML